MKKSYGFKSRNARKAKHILTLILVLSGIGSLSAFSQTCVQDQTIADFNFGTFGENTIVALDGDGAVILRPALNEEFSGSSLPSGWGQESWPLSTLLPTFSGGQIFIDGSHIYSTATFGPGSSLEFVATFTAGDFQNVGFSSDAAFNFPWVVIGRGTQGDNNVYARANLPSVTDISMGELLGIPHAYKILWNSNNFEFYIDGATTPAATIPHTLVAETRMVIQISDYYMTGTAVLSADRVRVAPYVSSGSYTSRVFDGVSTKIWGEAVWTAAAPAETSITIYARTGNTPVPDGSWTAFTEIPISGSVIGVTSRYIQYRADLSTTDPLVTPSLQAVTISCTDGPLSPPSVTVHPVSQVRCAGGLSSFTSVAIGVPAPTVQWEVSTDSGDNWEEIDGATNDTLEVIAVLSEDGYMYRAVWSNLQLPDAISNAATLTVNASDITGTIAAVNSTLCEGESIELQLSSATGLAPYSVIVNGYSYSVPAVNTVFATLETTEHSIWPASTTPVNANLYDGQAIEVGVKFRSSVPGYIMGIRFFHGTDNSGTYTGNLWSADGTLLASATFTNVTNSSWQEVRFSTPVSISANTTYVASYYSSSGYFAMTSGGLANAVENRSLTALASGTEGPNGVYRYGGGFPTLGGTANYFADVVFSEVGDAFTSLTYNLTSITDNNGCTTTGAISNVTVNVNPIPSGTITPVRTSVYEGEDYGLVFNATAGTGPFELIIDGDLYSGVASGTAFPAGQAKFTPKSIWSDATSVNTGGDFGSYELGRRFTSSVDGTITGIRFYKTGDQSLQFTVTLWDHTTRAVLATKTSGSISTPGWTLVNFDTPVEITANTSYVASYFAPGSGYYYAFNSGNPFPIVNPPLTAYESYYNPDAGFPTIIYAANYWVDVAFDDGGSTVSTLNLTSVTSSAGCVSTGDPISSAAITVNRANVWNGGGIDSDWNTAANWSSGVIPDGVNVVVPVVTNNNYPMINGMAATNDLVIAPSAMLTVNTGGSLTAGSVTINTMGTGSSGSLINLGTVTGPVTFNRYLRPEATSGDRHFFSSPVSGQNIDAFIINNTFGEPAVTKVAGLWEWDEDASDNWPEITLSTGSFSPGRGYNIDQTAGSDGLLSFTGTMNNEPPVITATAPYNSEAQHYNNERGIWGGGGWNLLGNPFTSSLRITDESGDDENDENDFLAKNLTSFDPSYQAVYIYDGTVGEHGTYYYIAKPVSFEDPFTSDDPAFTGFSSEYVQAGQGFYVLANYNNLPFAFTRDMQAHNTSVAMTKSSKADDSWPGLNLKVKYGGSESYTTIIYNDKMSAGLDPGYDVGQLGSGRDVEVYTTLVAKGNRVNFARQALPAEGADKIIVPVGIDSEKGGVVIFSAYTVPLASNKFWLEDRANGIFTDLTNKSYSVTLPAKTYGTGRFFIIASTNTPTSIQDPLSGSDLRIWTSGGKVIIKGEVSDKAVCSLFDVHGRLLTETYLTDGDLNTVQLPAGSKGVCIVSVTDGPKVTTGKVVIL